MSSDFINYLNKLRQLNGILGLEGSVPYVGYEDTRAIYDSIKSGNPDLYSPPMLWTDGKWYWDRPNPFVGDFCHKFLLKIPTLLM